MKILSIIDTMGHGGAESAMVNLITGMPEQEHMVIHFSSFFKMKPSEYLLYRLKNNNVPVKDMDYIDFEKAKKQREIFNEFPADIVLYYWWGNDLLLSWRKRIKKEGLNKPKFICSIQSMVSKFVQAGYDFYVPISKAVDRYQSHIPPGKKKVIYNGIDVARFGVSHMRRDKKKFIIGRVSTLPKRKIPKDWIRIASTFHIKNVHFVIAGEGSRRRELLNDIDNLDVRDKFSLPGYIHQSDLPALLSTFDICCYITGTHIEAQGLALIECAVAGLPIVSQPRGGISEMILHEETGFLSNDINKIKYYCKLLSDDKDLRNKMSKKARAFGMQFSIDRQCREYNELFKKLIKE